MKHLMKAPFTKGLPAPLFLRVTLMPRDAQYPAHIHAWGEFVFSFHGVVEVVAAGRHYLVPPQYGIWLPPNICHTGLSHREDALQSSFYVANELCGNLPSVPQALLISPFMRAALRRLRDSGRDFKNDRHLRLLYVLLDELAEAPGTGTFLPASDDVTLGKLLRYLERHPEDKRPVDALAREANTTERTLARRCLRDLGMTLSQWRNRLRAVKAVTMLEEGRTVESIALEFGYSTASSFISMFKKIMGTTPASFRDRTDQ